MMSIETAAVRTVIDATAATARPVIGIISIRMHLGALPKRESDEADQE
jgi:hypothetical protein